MATSEFGGGQSNVETLVHNRANPVTRTVERLYIHDSSSGLNDTAVRKVLCVDGPIVVDHWRASTDQTNWNYWKREDFAYSSALSNAFAPEGLRSPRLLRRVEAVDGSVELWLEDVAGRSGVSLSLDDHSRIARKLGRAQGRLATATPEHPWLSGRWLRQYALSRPPGPSIYEDPQAWEHPVVVGGFGDQRHQIRRAFGNLYEDSGRWFDLLERLPRTLAHLDFWPNNAIAANDGTDVLVDWAFVGDGAVGEDLGNWILDTFFDHFMEPELFDELDHATWQAYRDGLFEGGWVGDQRLARLGVCASAVKYIWLPGLMVATADHSGPTGYGGQPGYPLEEVFRRRGIVFGKLLDWIDEATELAEELRIGL